MATPMLPLLERAGASVEGLRLEDGPLVAQAAVRFLPESNGLPEAGRLNRLQSASASWASSADSAVPMATPMPSETIWMRFSPVSASSTGAKEYVRSSGRKSVGFESVLLLRRDAAKVG